MAIVVDPGIWPIRFVRGETLIACWIDLIKLVSIEGRRTGDKKKLPNTILVVTRPEPLPQKIQSAHVGLVGSEPWERTLRLYTTLDDLSWKRSYRARITGAKEGGTQLTDVVALLASRPGTSSACCVIARPQDVRRARVIASTVPCPLAIDLKSSDEMLNMTVLFRAQDVFRLGLADLHYLAALQREVLGEVNDLRIKRDRSPLSCGYLLFHLAVAFIRTIDSTRVAAAEVLVSMDPV